MAGRGLRWIRCPITPGRYTLKFYLRNECRSPAFGARVLLIMSLLVAGSTKQATGSAKHNGMVIIAPERFHRALKPIVTYRAGQRSTKLVSLETILMQTKGRDAPERLKRWLYSAWKEDHVRYVLLV